ncbi:MAG TPA: IS4 family transposase, partial [Kofleriaceae bacterium]|nr:IS4 family transposase [Kofleriaceae bacterium]
TWAHKSADRDRFRGLAVYGVDGTTMRVPDSEENRDYIGLGGQRARGGSGYPIVKMAALMALRSHLLVAASFGPYNNAEVGYAHDLWPKLPDDSIVILDKAYWGANILMPIAMAGRNRHWLTRGKTNFKGRLLRRLGKNDDLYELDVTPYARRKARARGCALPKTWTVRVIRYHRKGFRPSCVVTSLVDVDKYPADEIVRLYHERWELELGYGEVKTNMLDGIPLRSQKISRIHLPGGDSATASEPQQGPKKIHLAAPENGAPLPQSAQMQ